MTTPQGPQTVKVQCPVGHRLEATVESLVITHTAEVVVGLQFACDGCDEEVRIELAPSVLALVAELGVRLAPETLPNDAAPAVSNDHRRALSAKLLPGKAPRPARQSA